MRETLMQIKRLEMYPQLCIICVAMKVEIVVMLDLPHV